MKVEGDLGDVGELVDADGEVVEGLGGVLAMEVATGDNLKRE